MYSKEALDLYEQLLNKVASPIVFEQSKTAAVDWKSIPGKVKNFIFNPKSKFNPIRPPDGDPTFKKYVAGLSDKILNHLHTQGYPNVPDNVLDELLTKEIPAAGEHLVENDWMSPWARAFALGVPSAAIGGAYAGKNVGQSADEWDKMKYGLGGLGLGLLGPAMYTKLTGNNYLNALSDNKNPPAHTDFTSI
jgi:hypothetical protein